MRKQRIGRMTALVGFMFLLGLTLVACTAEPAAVPAPAPAPIVQPPAPAPAAAPGPAPEVAAPASAPQPQPAVATPAASTSSEPPNTLGAQDAIAQAIREARDKQREELLGLDPPEPVVISPNLEAMIDEYIEAAAKRGSFSGAILVAQGDKVFLSKGYGMADHENGIPNTPQTKFNIGNINRSITAAAILQLQEKGSLSVGDLLSKYIPDYPDGDQITLHHLLVSSSGIPSYGLFPEYAELSKSPTTPERLISLFKDEPLDFLPGNNVGSSASEYVLLGYIIQQVSGMPYEDYIQQNIFDPLGMSDSGYDINRPEVTNRAYGYLHTADGPVREEPTDASWTYAAAGLYSTAEDLYKWDRALATNKVLNKESIDDMFTSFFSKENGAQFGYGWILVPRTTSFYIQGGGGRYFAALCSRAVGSSAAGMLRVPGDDLVIIELNNSSTSIPTQIPADLFSIVTGLSYNLREEPTEKDYDSKTLDQYAGRFQRILKFDEPHTMNHNMQHSNFGAKSRSVTVSSENGGLFMEFEGSDFPTTQLFPESRSRFFAKANDLDISFIKTDLGGVTGFLVRINDRDTYRYRRMSQ